MKTYKDKIAYQALDYENTYTTTFMYVDTVCKKGGYIEFHYDRILIKNTDKIIVSTQYKVIVNDLGDLTNHDK